MGHEQQTRFFLFVCLFLLLFCVLIYQLNNEEGATLIPPLKAAGEPRSSMISASFNFINSIIGSGIIGKYFIIQVAYCLNKTLIIK